MPCKSGRIQGILSFPRPCIPAVEVKIGQTCLDSLGQHLSSIKPCLTQACVTHFFQMSHNSGTNILTSAVHKFTLLTQFQGFGWRANCPDGPNSAVAILVFKMSRLGPELPFTWGGRVLPFWFQHSCSDLSSRKITRGYFKDQVSSERLSPKCCCFHARGRSLKASLYENWFHYDHWNPLRVNGKKKTHVDKHKCLHLLININLNTFHNDSPLTPSAVSKTAGSHSKTNCKWSKNVQAVLWKRPCSYMSSRHLWFYVWVKAHPVY